MYGMVNASVEQMVVSAHGEEAWAKICQRAGLEEDVFVRSQGYPDSVTYRLIGAASEELGLAADKILEEFGQFWILRTAEEGYAELMAAGGRNLREFLLNLPNFHSRVSLIFPQLSPPHFNCAENADGSIRLDYLSERPGLAPFVRGLLIGLSRRYGMNTQIEQVGAKSDGANCDSFVIRW